MTLAEALEAFETYGSENAAWVIASRMREIQQLPETWRTRELYINDGRSPSLLIECVNELEDLLE